MRKGLTLIELLITVVMIAIMMAVTVYIFRAILLSWSGTEARAGIDIGLDRGIEEMVRDLREAKAIASVNNDEIRFTTTSDTYHIYYLYNTNDPYPPDFLQSSYELRKAELSGSITGDLIDAGRIIITDIVPMPELETEVCCSTLEGSSCTATCPGTIITAVKYVKYGASECGNLSSCDNAIGADCAAQPSCVGATSCSWAFNNTNCGEKCYGYWKTGYLTITCQPNPHPDLFLSGNIVTINLSVKRKDETINSKAQVRPRNLCGGSFTVSHEAHSGEKDYGVAPVDKVVTYGTVLSTLGGTGAKCWITQNLGATNQATSATDATEPSAGWYWQFNRQQGYKHDGTTRTPSSAWDVTNDNTYTGWDPLKDPCFLLLGTGWRLPTCTEWANADGAPENWWSYAHAYASVLKLHAAGWLEAGALGYRGSGGRGYFWSSTQANSTYGCYLAFDGSACYTSVYSDKAHGLSVRCLK